MNNVTLQVPVSREIKLAAQKRATEMGFSSLQEAVRVFLYQFAAGKVDVSFFKEKKKLN